MITHVFQAQKKQEAPISVPPVKGRPTLSLFGFGGGDDSATKQPPVPKGKSAPTLKVAKSPTLKVAKSPTLKVAKSPTLKVAKKTSSPQAPNGVPTISGWRLNGDGSVSGKITGSPNFRNGETVTTSPISKGRIEKGSVVQTGSGSRYFLG